MHSRRDEPTLSVTLLSIVAVLCAALSGAACADAEEMPDGSAGTESGGASSGGGEIPVDEMPPECRLPEEQDPKRGIEIRLENASDTPVYMFMDCLGRYEITSCADGYTKPLEVHEGCRVDCAFEPVDVCGSCQRCIGSVSEITPGRPRLLFWGGIHYHASERPSGCPCYKPLTFPGGRYRFRVPVYMSEHDAFAGLSPRWVSADFTLPLIGGWLSVPVAP
ncbi:uncharacterized protein CMC5_069460 [Chondromyces crocatus]|uniref:Secreted protein n=1 Tax=Chondromyces crocatus TaxID=52 RepID=A0A0K1EPI0_CHOCO|nr:uncharacterized protein CMC5_069460 [Chondromyces crocatus]